MTVWNAIILGLVQGVTEFLPVSSTGHLSIINNLFNMSSTADGHLFFDMLLRLAALSAILIVYWKDIVLMFWELLSFAGAGPLAGQPRERYPAARLFVMIAVGSLPMLIVLPMREQLAALYYKNIFIGVTLILTGCVLLVSDRMSPGKKTERSMSLLDSVIIGFCQCAASIAMLSRPAATITAGMATGLRRDFAVKFAFLLSIPAMLVGVILKLVDAAQAGIDWKSVPAYLVGTAVSLAAGIFAVNLMKYISLKGKFGGFAYYCWVVGVLGIILSMIF